MSECGWGTCFFFLFSHLHLDEKGDSTSTYVRTVSVRELITELNDQMSFTGRSKSLNNYTAVWVRNGNAKERKTKHEKRSQLDLWLWLILHSCRGACLLWHLLSVGFQHYSRTLPPLCADSFSLQQLIFGAANDRIHNKRPNLGHRQVASWIKFKTAHSFLSQFKVCSSSEFR